MPVASLHLPKEGSMFKRSANMFTKPTLWLAAMALLFGGFSHTTTGKDRATTTSKSANPHRQTSMSSPPLIPRDVLFGNPRRAQARLSHDGKWISFQAPVGGVLNIWVAPADNLSKAKAVTEEKVRPIPSHDWAYDNKHILYIQDKNGDENFHLYATNVVTGETKDLTPIDGVRAQLEGVSHKFPHEILVGLNDRDKRYHDIWRINIETGEKKLVQQNPGIAGFVTDDDFRVRLAMNYTPTGGQVLQVPEKDKDGEITKWKDFLEFGPEDAMTSGPAGFDKTGETLYLEDSRNRNTAGLFAMDLASGHTKLIADDKRTDVGGVLIGGHGRCVEEILFVGDTQCAGAVEVAAPCAPDICAPANARMLSSSVPVDLHAMVV